MKLLVVGVCDVPHSTNTFMVRAFEALGHEVETFNYRTIIRNGRYGTAISDMNDALMKKVNESDCDLVVLCKTDTVFPITVNFLSQIKPTFFFYMDPLSTALNTGAASLAKNASFCSATSTEVCEHFKANGSKNVFRIIEGIDTSLYKPVATDKLYDISFIGNKTHKRERIIRRLKSKGFAVYVFGNGWEPDIEASPPVYNEELVRTIGLSKIVLNFVQGNIYSDRVTMTLAAGGFLLSEYADELEKEYDIHKHMKTWKTEQDLVDKIEHFLVHYVAREAVAKAGSSCAKKYTWERTCKKILEAVDGTNI